MSKLVEELKKDHAVIAETLNKVKKLGIGSAEGQNILLAAKNSLLA
ncbi:MAG: hemerythrin domain-containing protein, partial [bacterium]|nr:hemerythrin domain-containing protein [bacterium]